ncbi:MAG TPA: hypothetical protein VFO19_01255, partial [Vicinamibacterales bacterium]|nr:hypothetical protein [Vicinamibacterales bacterium]
YHGVNLTVNKRFNDRWQLNGALTIQTNRDYQPTGSFANPTGVEFVEGTNEVPRYLFKLNGSYQLGWGITASGNLNWNDGDTRTRTITGPGQVFGGVGQSNITYNTLNYQPRDTERFDSTALLDAGVQKVFSFAGGRYRIKAMVDGFNLLNISTIQGYTSGNASLATSSQVNEVVPPRVFRFGAQFSF